jgi:hypothetical protein
MMTEKEKRKLIRELNGLWNQNKSYAIHDAVQYCRGKGLTTLESIAKILLRTSFKNHVMVDYIITF